MHACVRRDLRPRMQRDALVLPALFFLRFLFFLFYPLPFCGKRFLARVVITIFEYRAYAVVLIYK